MSNSTQIAADKLDALLLIMEANGPPRSDYVASIRAAATRDELASVVAAYKAKETSPDYGNPSEEIGRGNSRGQGGSP